MSVQDSYKYPYINSTYCYNTPVIKNIFMKNLYCYYLSSLSVLWHFFLFPDCSICQYSCCVFPPYFIRFILIFPFFIQYLFYFFHNWFTYQMFSVSSSIPCSSHFLLALHSISVCSDPSMYFCILLFPLIFLPCLLSSL